MITSYLIRGAKTGAIGGVVYGLFVALVGTEFVAFAETFEEGHPAAVGGPVVSEATTITVSVLSGIL